jgi:hypothetical protein
MWFCRTVLLEKLSETMMRNVSFWPMEFSSVRRGSSHLYNDRENGLADETLATALVE